MSAVNLYALPKMTTVHGAVYFIGRNNFFTIFSAESINVPLNYNKSKRRNKKKKKVKKKNVDLSYIGGGNLK